jgi:hypothetical protein
MMTEFDKLALSQSKIKLSNIEGVTVVGDWVPVNAGHSILMLNIKLQLLGTAPANDIPEFSTWGVIVDFLQDKWGKVEIHPTLDNEGITDTYFHQQYNGGPHETLPVRNGHICTLSSIHGLATTKNALKIEPKFTIERVIWHVERALEWLKAAATNSLTNTGESFELPDFNIPKSTLPLVLAYYESMDNYDCWENLKGRAGIATVSTINKTIIVRKYLNRSGSQTCYEPQWGDFVKKLGQRKAIWICLDQIPVINNWQVPSTMQELIAAGHAQQIDIVSLIKGVLENINDNSECFVLVGMPISNKNGNNPSRYHWQGFSLPAANKVKTSKIRAQLAVNHMTPQSPTPIKWFFASENWHPSDLQNRGQINKSLQESNVLLIGCGAFGSAIADLLIRMGVKKMSVVDKELFDSGNLVRHKLTLNQINNFKALELARYLNCINPSATVEGFVLSIPSKDKTLLEAISKATIVIDCSADDGVMAELPLAGLRSEVKIISCSMGLYANRLFFYADNATSFEGDEFNSWFQPFREEEHKLAEIEELPRGAGCWSPVTPAKLNRVSGLAGVAVELIEQIAMEEITNPVAICHEWRVPHLNLQSKIKVA